MRKNEIRRIEFNKFPPPVAGPSVFGIPSRDPLAVVFI